MSWYSARLLYEFGEDPPDSKRLFEESLILFRTTKAESPIKKLLRLARANEHEYAAAAGNDVDYTFREVLEVQEITGRKITDGTEVFYRLLHDPGPRALNSMRKTETRDWWTEGGHGA